MGSAADSLAAGVHTFTTSTGSTLSYHVTACSSPSAPLAVIQAPGWGIGRSLYVNSLVPLLPNHTVLNLSPRGSDESSRPDDVSTMGSIDMAEDLESLRKYLDIPAFPVLLGHSNGGTIALAYAELYPTRVEKLVLIDHQLLGTDAGARGPTWEKFKTQRENQPQFKSAYETWAGPSPTTDEAFAPYLGRHAPELHARPGEIHRSGEKIYRRPGIAKDLVLGHAGDGGLEAGRDADRLTGTGAGEDTGHHWKRRI
jgi:pimeloyl-ACP methyl ester carboxylesterase